jgi:hypothetical protein
MFIRIVTFRLNGIDADQYTQTAESVADQFLGWPGLEHKYWLADHAANTYGGVYVFDTRAAADRSRTTALFGQLTANPAFTDLEIKEFDTLTFANAAGNSEHQPSSPEDDGDAPIVTGSAFAAHVAHR